MKGATLSLVISRPLISADHEADDKRDQHDLEEVEIDGVADRQFDAVQDQAAGDHAAQADDRADRQVDAAGDDDEGHAHRQEGVERDVLRHQDHVGGRGEVRREDREEDDHGEERDEGSELHQRQEDRAVRPLVGE